MDFFRGLDVSCSTEATYICITIFKILFILLLEDKKMISNCFDIIITPRYFPDLSSWIDNVLFCMVICFSGCKNVKMIPLVGLFIGYHIICYSWSLSFIGDLFKIFGFSINTSSVCCFYKCRNPYRVPYRQATCLLFIFGNWSCSLWVARKKDLMRPQELRKEFGGKSGDCIQKGPSVLREMVAHWSQIRKRNE